MSTEISSHFGIVQNRLLARAAPKPSHDREGVVVREYVGELLKSRYTP
jgi:hypothetical protein